jgi:hypothetical protein
MVDVRHSLPAMKNVAHNEPSSRDLGAISTPGAPKTGFYPVILLLDIALQFFRTKSVQLSPLSIGSIAPHSICPS